jgi:hypothetical protein
MRGCTYPHLLSTMRSLRLFLLPLVKRLKCCRAASRCSLRSMGWTGIRMSWLASTRYLGHIVESSAPLPCSISCLPGVSNADIQKIVSSQLFRGVSYQLIAFYYIDAGQPQIDKEVQKLGGFLARQLGIILEQAGKSQLATRQSLTAYFGVLIAQVKQSCEAIGTSLRWRVPRSVETMQWALEVASAAHLQSIDSHLSELVEIASFPQDDLSTIEEAYRHQFISYHSSIELPDSSHRTEVGYEDIFVPPTFVWSKENIGNNLNALIDTESYRSSIPGESLGRRICSGRNWSDWLLAREKRG